MFSHPDLSLVEYRHLAQNGDSNLAHFYDDGTKVKIPSEIKPLLKNVRFLQRLQFRFQKLPCQIHNFNYGRKEGTVLIRGLQNI